MGLAEGAEVLNFELVSFRRFVLHLFATGTSSIWESRAGVSVSGKSQFQE